MIRFYITQSPDYELPLTRQLWERILGMVNEIYKFNLSWCVLLPPLSSGELNEALSEKLGPWMDRSAGSPWQQLAFCSNKIGMLRKTWHFTRGWLGCWVNSEKLWHGVLLEIQETENGINLEIIGDKSPRGQCYIHTGLTAAWIWGYLTQ